MVVKELLQLFVCKVDAKLFETIELWIGNANGKSSKMTK
jgi:hypothetical protein